MTTQVLNFIWLNLDCPAKEDPEDGIYRPLPKEYIDNVIQSARRNYPAEIHFWIDSRRLTDLQRDYLRVVLEGFGGEPNLHIKDLRDIPAYANEEFFNRSEENPDWRDDKKVNYNTTIWGQLDTAKILISLQGDFDQHFFADLDHFHVKINSEAVQGMLKNRGLMIGSRHDSGCSIENRLWGFETRSGDGFINRRAFFVEYLERTLKNAKEKGQNGYNPLLDMVRPLLASGIKIQEFCLPISQRGAMAATQPGHKLSGISGQTAPDIISSGELMVAGVFNRNAAKKKPPAPAASQPEPTKTMMSSVSIRPRPFSRMA